MKTKPNVEIHHIFIYTYIHTYIHIDMHIYFAIFISLNDDDRQLDCVAAHLEQTRQAGWQCWKSQSNQAKQPSAAIDDLIVASMKKLPSPRPCLCLFPCLCCLAKFKEIDKQVTVSECQATLLDPLGVCVICVPSLITSPGCVCFICVRVCVWFDQ